MENNYLNHSTNLDNVWHSYIRDNIDSIKIKRDERFNGEYACFSQTSLSYKRRFIEFAMESIAEADLAFIAKEYFIDFIERLNSAFNSNDMVGLIDNFVNQHIPDSNKNYKIKQEILKNITHELSRTLVDNISMEGKEYFCLMQRKCISRLLSGMDIEMQRELLFGCVHYFILQLNRAERNFDVNFISMLRRKFNLDALECNINKANSVDDILDIIMEYEDSGNIDTSYYFGISSAYGMEGALLISIRQSLIRRELEERDILDMQFLGGKTLSYLIHFSDKSNLESILKYGILSQGEMLRQKISYTPNDNLRLDKMPDYISLSLSSYNKYVLDSFKNKGSIKEPILIYINPSVLYNYGLLDIVFSDRNAAASAARKGNRLIDFKNMFVESLSYQTGTNAFNYNRQRDGRKSCEPTDLQAEILFERVIPLDYISHITDIKGNILYKK